MHSHSRLDGLKIALLIDFDNVILGVEDPGFDIELVVNALRARGIVVLGRAYGDWYRHNRHRRRLMEQGIELVETPVFGPLIKNSADIRIVLDGFEIAMSQAHIDTFCLVSGDSDFLPLIKKLQYLGKHVIVIAGNKFTSDLVRRNCNEFISYENLLAESVGASEDVSTLDGAFALLARTIGTLHERGMDVRSSTVKQMMVQLNPAFSERTYGVAQFKGFLDRAVRAGIIKLSARDPISGEYIVLLPDDAPTNGTAPLEVLAGATSGAEPEVEEGKTRNGRRGGNRRGGRRRGGEGVETPVEATEDEAAPVETTAEEDAGASLDAPDAMEVQAEVTPIETMNGSNLLVGRNLRRGRLRFTAGRASTRADAVAPAATESDAVDPVILGIEAEEQIVATTTPEALQDETTPQADALALTTEAEAPADTTPEAPADTTPEAPADTTPEAPADTTPAAPVDEAATPDEVEAAPEEAPAKKRAPRRRRKTVAPAGDPDVAVAVTAATVSEATAAVEAPVAAPVEAVADEAVADESSAADGATGDAVAEDIEVPKKPRRRRGGTKRSAAPTDEAAAPSDAA